MSWRILAARARSATRRIRLLVLAFACALVLNVGGADASGLHFEISSPNGVNQFSSYNYICPDCTIAEYDAMVLPVGYAKRNTRILLPATSGGLPGTPPPGIAAALDFVPTISGDDFFFCCDVLDGGILGIDPSGVIFNTAKVKRDNVFTYAAGTVMHDVIDPLGNRYGLFLIDLALAGTLDLSQANALAGLALPAGWTYDSRVLTTPLELRSQNGLTSNFGQIRLGVGVLTAFQLYEVPEPGTLLLVGSGLLALGAMRRDRGWRPSSKAVKTRPGPANRHARRRSACRLWADSAFYSSS